MKWFIIMDKCGSTLCPEGCSPWWERLPDTHINHTFEADGYIEAAILYHEHMGWSPYNPMEEDREEYVVALKKLGKTPQWVNQERELAGLPRLEWLDKL